MAEPKAPHPLRPATTADHPAAAAPTSTYTPDTDVHILDRLAVLYRYRRVAIAVFILTTVAMMIQGYSSTQMYRAQAPAFRSAGRRTGSSSPRPPADRAVSDQRR